MPGTLCFYIYTQHVFLETQFCVPIQLMARVAWTQAADRDIPIIVVILDIPEDFLIYEVELVEFRNLETIFS